MGQVLPGSATTTEEVRPLPGKELWLKVDGAVKSQELAISCTTFQWVSGRKPEQFRLFTGLSTFSYSSWCY